MKIVELKCPNCHASLTPKNNNKKLPIILAIFPNFKANFLPKSSPNFVKKALIRENTIPHKTIFSFFAPRPIPTEKLSRLTLKAKSRA